MRRSWSDDEVAMLVKHYATLPTSDLMLKLDRSRKSIYTKSRSLGIEKIGRPGWKFPEHLRRYRVPDSFLSPMTPQTAYLCGLVLADGCIRDGRFSISSKDKAYLRSVLDLCRFSQPIYAKHNGKHVTYSVSIVSKTATQRIVDIGIHERKSLTARMPQIPKDLFGDFLRGYFDGDGGVYRSCRGGLRMKFTSGSARLLSDIKLEIRRACDVNGSEIKTDKGRDSAFRLWYYGDSARRVADLMYENTGGVCMERKREVFHMVASRQTTLPL